MADDDPRVWLADARRLHRAGESAAALAAYLRVLERVPNHPEILQLAAMAAAQSNELQTAVPLARQALDVRGDDAGRLTLGRVLLQAGDLEEALTCLTRIAAGTRLAADAAYHAGQILRRLERIDEAERALEQATDRAPGHAPAWNELGVVRLERGSAETAIPCFRESLRHHPGHAATLTNMANALFQAGDFAGCEQTIDEVLAGQPGHGGARALLGRLRKTQGRLPEARRIWQSLVDADPDDADARHGLAATLQAAGELEAAGQAHDAALALAPGRPDLVAARAEWLEWQGRYTEGLEALAELAQELQGLPGPTLVQARLERRIGRADVARSLLERTLAETAGNLPLRRQFCFSLGDVCDEMTEYETAWRWYEEGNGLTPASYDGAGHRAWLKTIEDRCPRPSPADLGGGVVFIVGMPRSGTSLIEHILATHPSVHAGGERSTLGELVHGMVSSSGDRSPDEATRIGQRYLADLPALIEGQTCVTDKMPTNFLYLPVIQAALPKARIVHCRRDPRDSGLSCFCTDFVDPTLAFASRPDWLADFVRAYLEQMARWVPRMRDRVLEVDYESLVRQPEQGVRELLAFLDLAWDDRCLSFHTQDRVVATASHAQVRQPIHSRSIGRWRHYQAHLGPLLEVPVPPDQSSSA